MTARVRTAVSLGLLSGLVIGGVVADQISDNAAFLVATALSLVGAISAVFVLPGRVSVDESSASRPADKTRAWRELLAIPTLRIIFAANALLFFAVSGSIYQWSSDFGGALGPAAGLELGRYVGYGWAYALVGAAVLGMAPPLRWLHRHERGAG